MGFYLKTEVAGHEGTPADLLVAPETRYGDFSGIDPGPDLSHSIIAGLPLEDGSGKSLRT